MQAGSALSMQLHANATVVTATTFNVLASMPRGNPGTTIIVGSHLDSVPAGPGINDNGSGSGVNLELALQFAALNTQPKNKVGSVCCACTLVSTVVWHPCCRVEPVLVTCVYFEVLVPMVR